MNWPVSKLSQIIQRKYQEKGRRARHRRSMSYLLVCDALDVNGNSILASLPPLLTLTGTAVAGQWRKELNIIHS